MKFLETVPLLANQLPRADLPTLAAALVEKRSPEMVDDGPSRINVYMAGN